MADREEALAKAAASPDPNVRNMAIRYREMQKEFASYDAFFEFYQQGIGATLVPARKASAPLAERPTAVKPRVPRAKKNDSFDESMKAILIEHGRPMKLNDLYTTYQQKHPEDPTSDGTFRQRLVKRRETIPLIKGSGYWWHDAPLPDASETAPVEGD